MERRPKGSRVLSLVSGLDSCIMTSLLGGEYEQVTPLFVRCGLKWENAEVASLKRFFDALDCEAILPTVVLELGAAAMYGEHWSVGGAPVPDTMAPDADFFLPGRNLLLLSVAATYGSIHRISDIAIGILGTNPFPDAGQCFLRSMEKTARLALGRNFRVLTPLSGMDKAEVLQTGQELPIELSLSCADPVEDKHCGLCGKCGERRRGFIDARIEDRTDYVQSGAL